MVKLLALSGSLRKASSNTALLHAACSLAEAPVKIQVSELIGALPLFNPDFEENLPEIIREFRRQVKSSDGLLIASPEYAHGVTGAIKNALDWLVGGPEFVKKPVAVMNASPRSIHAYESLKEIIKTMDGHLVQEACLTVPLPNNKITKEGIMSDVALCSLIKQVLLQLQSAIQAYTIC